jgi:hypothetical protein
MAEYLPIRAFNRSQNVRINKAKISPTATTLIDISNAAVRKEFAYHSAIGAVYTVGPVVANNSAVVLYGLVASYKEAKKVKVTAGAYKTLSTGVGTSVAEATPEFTKPTENNRKDIVELKVADGSIKIKEGTQAASPTVPTVDTGYITLYSYSVAKNAEEATGFTDIRPF